MSQNESMDVSPDEELRILKARATQMGIEFHHRAGVEKLRELIGEKLSGKPSETEEKESSKAATKKVKTKEDIIEKAKKPVSMLTPVESKQQRRNRIRRKAHKLVRVRVTNMNPNKSAHEGEIFTVSNSVIGTIRRYVPYNVPWHVESIIYEHLKERTYMHFVTTKDSRGNKVKKTKIAKELSVENLDPLSPEELAKLAQRQAARASNED